MGNRNDCDRALPSRRVQPYLTETKSFTVFFCRRWKSEPCVCCWASSGLYLFWNVIKTSKFVINIEFNFCKRKNMEKLELLPVPWGRKTSSLVYRDISVPRTGTRWSYLFPFSHYLNIRFGEDRIQTHIWWAPNSNIGLYYCFVKDLTGHLKILSFWFVIWRISNSFIDYLKFLNV